MAGDSAGPRGEVQVWSPEKCAIWRRIQAFSMVIAGFLAVGAIIAGIFHNPGIVVSGIGFPLILLATAAAALRRPCFITTDNEGIGVTTTKSSRALRWDEIQSFEYNILEVYCQLKLNSGEKLRLNLTGYTEQKRKSLRSLIEVNADLYPHPKIKDLLVRRSIPLPGGSRNR